MEKEEFVKIIRLIQNFMSQQDTLRCLMGKLTDGYFIVTMGDSLINIIIELISEKMEDKEISLDLLKYLLYENIENKYVEEDGKKYHVGTPEGLYDYLTK